MRDWMDLNGDGEIDSSENNKDDFDQKKMMYALHSPQKNLY